MLLLRDWKVRGSRLRRRNIVRCVVMVDVGVESPMWRFDQSPQRQNVFWLSGFVENLFWNCCGKVPEQLCVV
jgi:hypothetical protein